jgi:hypothetical protein
MLNVLTSQTACLALMILSIASAAPLGSSFLDATKPIVLLNPGQEDEPSGVWFSSQPMPEQNLHHFRIRLLKLDRSEYRQMEKVVYDVAVKNITNRALIIPWSPNPIARRDQPVPGYRIATFYLRLIAENYPDYVGDFFRLYGSSDIPGSLKRIRPGEEVVFRLPAVLSGNGLQVKTNPILNPPADLYASVEFELLARDDSLPFLHEPRSENSLPIKIRRPRTTLKEERPKPFLIEKATPQSSSAGCAVLLTMQGINTYEFFFETTVTFSKDGINLFAEKDTQTNEPPDMVEGTIYIPPEATSGIWEISASRQGKTTPSVSITVSEWMPPKINRISPARVNPGACIEIQGTYFHYGDQVEIVSSGGFAHTEDLDARNDTNYIRLPKNIPDGEAAVRIRTKTRSGAVMRSESYILTVTPAALPPSAWSLQGQAAPGQWVYFEICEADLDLHKDRSEAFDFEFDQSGRTLYSRSGNLLRLQIPKELVPGPVKVRARTCYRDSASEWSEPVSYYIRAQPAVPEIWTIRVGNGVANISLSERTESFEARPGDELSFLGYFPFVHFEKLRLILEGPSKSYRLKGEKISESHFRVRLPSGLRIGTWRLILSTPDSKVLLPVSMNTF